MGRAMLFSGHMIDQPGRKAPRFPPWLEPAVTTSIREALEEAGASPDDMAISSAACGGDLIFLEACSAAGLRARVYLPFEPEVFREKSVDFADRDWGTRFDDALAHAEVFVATRILAPPDDGMNAYQQVNRWMVEEARRLGTDGVELILLWDGEEGDGEGGTKDMMERAGGPVRHIDIRKLRLAARRE